MLGSYLMLGSGAELDVLIGSDWGLKDSVNKIKNKYFL